MNKATPNQDDSQPTPRVVAGSTSAGPSFAEPESATADLSREILEMLPRSAGERITCRHITGNHYRCNWWSPHDTDSFDNPSMTGLTVTTHRVIKSQMLHVTRGAEGLTIKPARGR